jgi:hypothetical protein
MQSPVHVAGPQLSSADFVQASICVAAPSVEWSLPRHQDPVGDRVSKAQPAVLLILEHPKDCAGRQLTNVQTAARVTDP